MHLFFCWLADLNMLVPELPDSFWFTKRRATAVGLAMSGGGFGTAAMGPFITALLSAQGDDEDGWRTVLRIMSAISAMVVCGAGAFYKRPDALVARLAAMPKQPIKIDTLILKDPV